MYGSVITVPGYYRSRLLSSYWSAATGDYIDLEVPGSDGAGNVVRITSHGNVGVGTTNPSSPLPGNDPAIDDGKGLPIGRFFIESAHSLQLHLQTRNGTTLVRPAVSSSPLVKPVTRLPFTSEHPSKITHWNTADEWHTTGEPPCRNCRKTQ